jgi:hypothetical protein
MHLIESESVIGEFEWRRWLRPGSLAQISKSPTEVRVHMEGDSRLTLEAGPAMELASLVINGVSPSTRTVNLDPSCNHTIVVCDLYVVR